MKRGIRNNNAGNIERTDRSMWQGMSEDQSTDDRFCVFDSAKWGIRAIARTLITYQDKRKAKDGSRIDTVTEIIERWAPPCENPTLEYSVYIASVLNIGTHDRVDVYDYKTMRGLVESIIKFENGSQPYSRDVIDEGLRLAGIDVPQGELKRSKTMLASTAATMATITPILIEEAVVLEEIKKIIVPMADQAGMEWLKYVAAGLTLVSVGVILWSRIESNNG